MVRASIVVVSYNQERLLNRCLKSLESYVDFSRDEVIVVDNNSTDLAIRKLPDAHPSVRFVLLDSNLGFGRANNLAAQAHARGKYLLFLNPDTLLIEQIVDPLVEHFDKYPGIAIIGPRLLNPDRTIQSSTHGYPSIVNECLRLLPGFEWLKGRRRFAGFVSQIASIVPGIRGPARYRSYRTEVQEVNELTGACFLIEKEYFNKIGGFDPLYFMYQEEADLCFRVIKDGRKIVYYPMVSVVHELHGARKEMAFQKELDLHKHRSESVIYFFKKNRGPVATGLLRVSLSFVLLMRILPEMLLAPIWREAKRTFAKDWVFLRVCLRNAS